jgi:glycosyltransferase involved in cell wall biosynthesis
MAAKGDVPIEMLGHVPKSEVAGHYRWADTVLVALRPWPALSLAVPSKLYEAMSIGIHITGSVAGETAEIIRDTGAGLTVAPGDADALAEAWAGLASDPGSLAVDRRGREWTREHADNDLLAEHYLTILHDVVSRHG